MKKPAASNPRRLDVQRLAEQGGTLGGQSSLSEWPRLAADEALKLPGAVPQADAAEPGGPVRWQARAECRPVRGGGPEVWLHLQASTSVTRICQRCLGPVALALRAERSFLFAPSEDQAQAWDADRDDADVLTLGSSFDLIDLVEDELLLSVPLVPRHENCPQPLPGLEAAPADRAGQLAGDAPRSSHPFAVLARLKSSGG